MGPGAPAKQSKHGHGIDVDHAAKAETEEQPKQHTGTDESALAAGDAKSENEIGPRGADDPQNPDKRAAVGRDVPPLSDDNKDLAENWDERKEKKQEFDALVRFSLFFFFFFPSQVITRTFGMVWFSEGHSKKLILIRNVQNTG